jgi:outer membrane protein assembly factor BamB
MKKEMVLFLVAAGGVLSMCSGFQESSPPDISSSEWPMLHGTTERTRFSDDAAPDSPYVLWSENLNEINVDSPIISNDRVYILGSYSLSVLSLETGELLNSFDLLGWATLTISQNVLFFPSGHNLVCFDTATASVLWKSPMGGGSTSNPVVYCGKVFMGGGWCPFIEGADKREEKKVRCLDQFTGDVVWEFFAKGKVCSSPSLSEGILYIGSWDTNVYALDSDTGNMYWKASIGAPISESPVIFGDSVLVTADRLYCLDRKTGMLVWEFQDSKEAFHSKDSPAVAYGLIFFASRTEVYALDGAGVIVWETTPESDVTSSLVADGTRRIRTSDKTVYKDVLQINKIAGIE